MKITPENTEDRRMMYVRVFLLVSFIFILCGGYIPMAACIGGLGFTTYGEAVQYYFGEIWESISKSNLINFPIKLLFLPFIGNGCRPGWEWVGLIFGVIYYTFWFYLTGLSMKILHRKINRLKS